jgi:Tol biopolymer transport system component
MLAESDGQVDATWSPDGKKIAFGRTPDTAPERQIVSVIDLVTHQVSTVPGSKGLYSPRWSPDGRYLAALNLDSTKLLLFDFKIQKWSDWITEPGALGYPNWSPDGSYLYYDSAFTGHPTFRRLRSAKSTRNFCSI